MDVLLYQDRKQLLKLLNAQEKLTIDCNNHSKKELIEVLFPSLLNRQLLKERFEQLEDDEKVVIIQMCYDKRVFFSKEDMVAFIPSSKKHYTEDILSKVMNIGFLFPCSNYRYSIPHELKRQTIEVFKQPFKDQELFISFAGGRKKTIHILNDLLSFIDYVTNTPLLLTKNGSIYKKDFNGIMNFFDIKEELPTEQWRFGYGRRFYQYPDRFSLLYDFCFKSKWIVEEDGYLRVTKKAEELNDLSVSDLLNGLLNYWMKLYKGPVPLTPVLFKVVTEVLEECHAIEEDIFIEYLSPFVEDYYYDTRGIIIKTRLLTMLEHFQILYCPENRPFRCYTLGMTYELLRHKKLW